MKRNRSLRLILTLLTAAVFLGSAAMVLRIRRTANREQQAFAQLSAQVRHRTESAAAQAAEPEVLETQVETEAPEVSPYQGLKEQNPDFYGWLSIEGTAIDYPVMYTPEDPEHYLRRAFDGTDSHSGVPFLDGSCFPGCGNALIYGHNLNTGGMFSDLLAYEDEEFRRDHPVIQFDTLTSQGTYAVFAVFYTAVSGTPEAFPYYQYTDLRDEAAFSAYVEGVTQSSLYDTGITPQSGDALLTLSTCSYHAADGRFVVVACRTDAPAPTA